MNQQRVLTVAGFVEEVAKQNAEEVTADAVPFMQDMLFGLCLAWNRLTNQELPILEFTHMLNTLAVDHIVTQTVVSNIGG